MGGGYFQFGCCVSDRWFKMCLRYVFSSSGTLTWISWAVMKKRFLNNFEFWHFRPFLLYFWAIFLTEVDLKLSYTYRFTPFCVPGLKSWFWQCHCVQNHRITHETADRCLIWPKILFGNCFEKNLLLKIGQNQPKRKEKIFELFLNFFFQTMICSQNVLQTQGFQTLTSDFQYRAYSWRFLTFENFTFFSSFWT